MRIAFGAILFLALLVPGFLFYIAYRYDENTEGIPVRFPVHKIVAIALLSFALHVVFYVISIPAQHYFEQIVDGSLVVQLIIGTDVTRDTLESEIWNASHYIVFYFASLYLFAAFSGHVVWWFVWRFSLDMHHRWLRRNPFYYLVTGLDELRFSGEFRNRGSDVLVMITALVKTGEGNFLYSGYYVSAEIDSDQQIIFLVLGYPDRRTLHPDEEYDRKTVLYVDGDDEAIERQAQHPRYNIEGNYILIRGEDISNICFFYHVYRVV